MRKTPYNFTAPPAATPAAQPVLKSQSYEQSVIRDLSSEIARPVHKPTPQPQTEPKPGTENVGAPLAGAQTQAEPEKKAGTANLGEEVEKFKKSIEGDINQAIADPKRAGKNVLKFLNMARLFLYPWIYKRAIFEGPELTAIDTVLKKVADAKRQSKEPEFDPFEKGVYEKYQFYDSQKKGILWTETEIDQINEVAYLKLAEIKFLQWLMVNEWAIVIIYIESKRFVPLFAHRMGFGAVDTSIL